MEKDIVFIDFWPDAEALRINLWNVLQKAKRERERKKVYSSCFSLRLNGTRFHYWLQLEATVEFQITTLQDIMSCVDP